MENEMLKIELKNNGEQIVKITDSYIEYLKDCLDINEKVFIVSRKTFFNEISNKLKKYNITVFCDFSSNPKYEEIKNGLNIFKTEKYNTIVSIGGGSAIDIAKCIKLFSTMKNEYNFLEKKYISNNIKHIAIPTTAGTGSESTQFAVMYYNNEKFSIDHECILPNIAILDYNLIKTLPDYQKKSTLLDSLCQGIESYWSKGATNESKIYASKCISLILKNYKNYLNGEFDNYRDILLASNYSGKAINITRTTAAHAMSYKLTSLYGISHGHAVALCLLPIWKLLFEESKANKTLSNVLLEISKLFGSNSIEESIKIFKKIIEELHMPKVEIEYKDLEILTNSVNLERMKNNPVIFTATEINNLYKNI